MFFQEFHLLLIHFLSPSTVVRRPSDWIRNVALTLHSKDHQGHALCSHVSSNAITGQWALLIKHAPPSPKPSVSVRHADIKVLFTLIQNMFFNGIHTYCTFNKLNRMKLSANAKQIWPYTVLYKHYPCSKYKVVVEQNSVFVHMLEPACVHGGGKSSLTGLTQLGSTYRPQLMNPSRTQRVSVNTPYWCCHWHPPPQPIPSSLTHTLPLPFCSSCEHE